MSRTAFFSPGSKASAGDVVRLVGDAGDQCLGEVNFFATAMGKNFCCVTQWNALGSNKFQKSAESLVSDNGCLYSPRRQWFHPLLGDVARREVLQDVPEKTSALFS